MAVSSRTRAPENRTTVVGERFALFADCLYLGLLVLVSSLPLVTAYAAITAGCGLLRQRVREDTSFTVGTFFSRLLAVIRHQWLVLVAPLGLALLLGVNAVAVASGAPGADLVEPVLWLIGAALLVVGLRAAVLWTPDTGWRETVEDAGTATVRDPVGSLLLLGAAFACYVIAGQTLMLVPLVCGLLVFAAVAVTGREHG